MHTFIDHLGYSANDEIKAKVKAYNTKGDSDTSTESVVTSIAITEPTIYPENL